MTMDHGVTLLLEETISWFRRDCTGLLSPKLYLQFSNFPNVSAAYFTSISLPARSVLFPQEINWNLLGRLPETGELSHAEFQRNAVTKAANCYENCQTTYSFDPWRGREEGETLLDGASEEKLENGIAGRRKDGRRREGKMENGNAVVAMACRTREEARIRGTKSWNNGWREYGVGGFQSNPPFRHAELPSVMSGTDWRQVERDQNVSNTSDP
ncbi:hypothetical protein K0M31_012335 [Melipona bicolor]|uniref:Uncharacterized protein n=1 Tax=Melipona bicolor TaxID=60889 RepID=A0AA40KHD0_9HYME|nr:hypothetical protein K0M31_012335 [Melipona bicolor]